MLRQAWDREKSTRRLSIQTVVDKRNVRPPIKPLPVPKPKTVIEEEEEEEEKKTQVSKVPEKPSASHEGGAEMGYFGTLIHLLKGNVGAGLFAMADAFANCGIILGPILTLALAIICVHSQHLLVSSAREMQMRKKLDHLPTFGETIELVFQTGPGKCPKYTNLFKRVANIFICLTQLGFCCIYIVFIADNTKQVLDIYGWTLDVHILMAIIVVPILLSAWIRDLKYLVPVSLAADVLMLGGIVGTLYMISIDVPSPDNLPYVAHYSRIPLFLGTTIFAFEGISLVLPLAASMKKTRNFSRYWGVHNVGMTLVTSLMIMIGTLGYIKYREGAIYGSITLNLPQDNVLCQCIKMSISIGIMLTYAIQLYVPILIIWPPIEAKFGPFKFPAIMEIIFRSFLVFITFVLAEVVPYLGIFTALIGAFCSTALALLYPAVLDIVTRWKEIGPLRLTKNIFILFVGMVGFLTGTYASIGELIRVTTKEK